MIVFMADFTERYFFLFLLCILLHVRNVFTDDPVEKHDSTVYSSSKANDFLSYEKCMQRMKCPVNRKEECSEECQAGNTEEEIEEHKELTTGEHRNSMKKKPKPKFDTDKQSNKDRRSLEDNQSTIKADL